MTEEHIIYGVAAADGKSDGILAICKLGSSTPVKSFKHNISSLNRTSVLPTAILVAQADRPVINVYSMSKDAPVQRIVVPEKLSCIAVSHSSKFLAAGTYAGRLVLWELGSGACLYYREAHYKAITKIVFSADDALIFTASVDTRLYSWRLLDLCTGFSTTTSDAVKPAASANLHNLAISDIVCGYGHSSDSRVYTVSTDNTCRVWSADGLKLYSTFVFGGSLTSIAVDPAERAMYIGSSDGSIYYVELYKSQQEDFDLAYVGGLQRSIQISKDTPLKFAQHEGKVLCLDLSFDATELISGGADGSLIIWDIATRQVLHSTKVGKAGDAVGSAHVYAAKVLQSLPSADVFRLQSLKFSYDNTYLDTHETWLTIPTPPASSSSPGDDYTAAEEINPYYSNVTYSITDRPSAAATIIADSDDISPTSVSLGRATSAGTFEDLQVKYEKLNVAYNSLWTAYASTLEKSNAQPPSKDPRRKL
ncbi:WD40-repeat-containing domain protein [Limtongia smithiae]|uniref:WD40-repeat-containing domain protein n=1 Tax=Limtongia smithiae TaxID=1125753 RepID=UPI0034D00D7D